MANTSVKPAHLVTIVKPKHSL